MDAKLTGLNGTWADNDRRTSSVSLVKKTNWTWQEKKSTWFYPYTAHKQVDVTVRVSLLFVQSISPDNAFQHCMMAYCTGRKQSKSVAEQARCSAIASLASMCAEQGVVVFWRSSTFCSKCFDHFDDHSDDDYREDVVSWPCICDISDYTILYHLEKTQFFFSERKRLQTLKICSISFVCYCLLNDFKMTMKRDWH